MSRRLGGSGHDRKEKSEKNWKEEKEEVKKGPMLIIKVVQ